ncbi:Uncharacterised protein [uncultured Roseburia sp.]|uniref:DUF5702 domain-containing protein n=1 Tax=Brotonthovivens ammoniilytica TaxID=2981725 RepID=A0ABT2TJT6_9FIRM|nr:DUF5702 domain-containing protein [Brotonthovivens ammoniilytica]MCU6761897.1 DUF5702 domain-containing protein [Brotonthovivens ammoniilytica]SCI50002.1 Uncharacterised protein [uncultured Roseburia sp.]
MKRQRGSITVFVSMILILVISVIFVFLESARVSGLRAYAKMDAALTGNSVMAEYSRPLWENYKLLFLDGSYETEQFRIENIENRGLKLSDENLLNQENAAQIQTDLYPLRLNNLQIRSFELASDSAGRALKEQAAAIMKKEIGSDMLDKLYLLVTGKLKDENGTKEDNTAGISVPELELTENPIETVEKMRAKGILALVMPGQEVSSKSADLSELLSNRTLRKGNWDSDSGSDWKTRLLFQQYLMKYFSNFSECRKDRILDYEIEYLLGGKKSDRENLKVVVRRLILIREAANIAFLQTDPEKGKVIQAAATAIALAAAQPELIPVFKQSLVAAWAYAESISDVKLLLDEQKVSLIKTKEQWNTDISRLGAAKGEKKQDQGLSYEEYLQMLLWTAGEKKVTSRCMDLIELNENIKMDHMISQMECRYTYEAEELFSLLFTIGQKSPGKYSFWQTKKVSYQE